MLINLPDHDVDREPRGRSQSRRQNISNPTRSSRRRNVSFSGTDHFDDSSTRPTSPTPPRGRQKSQRSISPGVRSESPTREPSRRTSTLNSENDADFVDEDLFDDGEDQEDRSRSRSRSPSPGRNRSISPSPSRHMSSSDEDEDEDDDNDDEEEEEEEVEKGNRSRSKFQYPKRSKFPTPRRNTSTYDENDENEDDDRHYEIDRKPKSPYPKRVRSKSSSSSDEEDSYTPLTSSRASRIPSPDSNPLQHTRRPARSRSADTLMNNTLRDSNSRSPFDFPRLRQLEPGFYSESDSDSDSDDSNDSDHDTYTQSEPSRDTRDTHSTWERKSQPDYSTPDDPTEQTSGRSLSQGDNKYQRPASDVDSSWRKNSKVSKSQSRKHKKRRSKPRYTPTMAEKFPSVDTFVKPILRKTDPTTSDLSCFPLSEYKRKLRVGLDTITDDQTYCKSATDLLDPNKDLQIAWCPQNRSTFESEMQRNSLGILKRAKVTHAPTSTMTYNDDFKLLSKYMKNVKDPNSDTAINAINTAMSGLTVADRKALQGELDFFEDAKLVRAKNLDNAGYDLLMDRTALSFMEKDKYIKNEHAANVLSAWVDGVTIIYDTEAERQKALDTGFKIDTDVISYTDKSGIEAMRPANIYDQLMSNTENDTYRDYTTTIVDKKTKEKHLAYTTEVLDSDDTQVLRNSVLTQYDEIAKQLKGCEYMPRAKVSSVPYSWFDKGQKVEAAMARFRKEMASAKGKDRKEQSKIQNQALNGYHKSSKSIERTNYLHIDDYKELYPLTVEYPTYTSVLDAAATKGDNKMPGKWWRQKGLAGRGNIRQ